MHFLVSLASFINRITNNLGRYISWLTTVLVLLVCYDVVSRYFFKTSFVGVQELEWHIFAAIFLLGASYTLKNDQHVRVDIIYSKLSDKRKAIVDIFGVVLFLIPFCVVIIIASKDFVINSFLISESSPDPGGLPARFIIKSILPVSIFFLLLQGISLLIKSILILLNKPMEN